MKPSWGTFLLAAALIVPGGCARHDHARPLTPDAFTAAPAPRRDQDIKTEPLSRVDQPGQLFNNVHVDLLPPPDAPHAGGIARPSKTVQENVTAPGAEALTAEPATAPATMSATVPATTPSTMPVLASGQYLTIGGVVADVNGTPIYTKKVIALAEPALAAQAPRLTREQFRAAAAREISDQTNRLITAQLQYAAAEKNLDERERKYADFLTTQWRQSVIRAAGGSEEVARKRAAARGYDFDELVQQQYRLAMRQIFVQKKLMPQAMPSAEEIRAYYKRNRDREFADPGSARFRLIKIDAAKSGGEEKARQRIESIRDRVVKAGESFDIIAHSENDDAHLRSTGGDIGPAIQKGAFALEPVEQAVWNTNDGDVTPVVQVGGAFYLAKVEEKKTGHVRPFEDEEVQAQIADHLSAMQLNELQQRMVEGLIRDAVVHQNAEMMNTAVEIAMQNYPRWAGK